MLFKNSNTLREYAQLGEVNFISIKATIQSAEDKHIIPVLGRALYNDLNNAYAAAVNENALDAALLALLMECRKAVAPYTCYYYAPKTDVHLTDAGIRREETTTNKTAYQYQNTAFREANLQEAETGIENLIAFLENNKDHYAAWTASEEYKLYRSLFIKTASDFNLFFPSHTPFRNYWAMRSKMVDVEEMAVKGFLGDRLFATLKEKDLNNELTTEQVVVMYKLKKAIALLTVAAAVPFLNVRISDNGITVTTTAARSDSDAIVSRSGAATTSLDFLIHASNASGNAWLKNAGDFMRTKPLPFAAWSGLATNNNETTIINTKIGVFGL